VPTKRRLHARRSRLLPWLVGSVVAFVLGLTPRSHAVLCLARLGLVAAAPVAAAPERHCSCCDANEPASEPAGLPLPAERAPGEERAGSSGLPGCCLDLQSDLELGPLPSAELPAAPLLVAVALPAVEPLMPSNDPAAHGWAFDTGPPRTDARTALRSTVVLRL